MGDDQSTYFDMALYFIRRNSASLHMLVAGATTNNKDLSIINPR
jgi:hypothetical protein